MSTEVQDFSKYNFHDRVLSDFNISHSYLGCGRMFKSYVCYLLLKWYVIFSDFHSTNECFADCAVGYESVTYSWGQHLIGLTQSTGWLSAAWWWVEGGECDFAEEWLGVWRWRSGAVDKQSYPVLVRKWMLLKRPHRAQRWMKCTNPKIVQSFVGRFGRRGSHGWSLCYCWSLPRLKPGCVQPGRPLRWASGCWGTRIHFGQQHSQSSVGPNTAAPVSEAATRGQEWLCSSSVISGDFSLKMHFSQSAEPVSFYYCLHLRVYGLEVFPTWAQNL